MRGKEGRVVITWIRERITSYGYVAQSAASFDAPDTTVYVMLDCMASKKIKGKRSPMYQLRRGCKKAERTSLSSCIVHAHPSLANHRRLRSNAQLFICSYVIKCNAPLPTPTSASVMPR